MTSGYAVARFAPALTLFFETDDLDTAIELAAARIPAARIGGAIEVRRIVEW